MEVLNFSKDLLNIVNGYYGNPQYDNLIQQYKNKIKRHERSITYLNIDYDHGNFIRRYHYPRNGYGKIHDSCSNHCEGCTKAIAYAIRFDVCVVSVFRKDIFLKTSWTNISLTSDQIKKLRDAAEKNPYIY
jgi:hypothetical protein